MAIDRWTVALNMCIPMMEITLKYVFYVSHILSDYSGKRSSTIIIKLTETNSKVDGRKKHSVMLQQASAALFTSPVTCCIYLSKIPGLP